jgi:HD superfamily phosphohydrolase
MLDRPAERHEIADEAHTAARAAALLHDVGHGSLSHVMEKVLSFHHESWLLDFNTG